MTKFTLDKGHYISVNSISNGAIKCKEIRRKDLEKTYCFPEKKKVRCSTLKEFSNVLCSNTKIDFKHIEVNILDEISESPYITVAKTGSGWEFILHDLDNVIINGNGSHLLSTYPDASVLVLKNCRNIVLKNFEFGHNPGAHHCEGSVVRLENTYNCFLKKLDLYGCGTYGIYAVDSDFKGRKLKIHHCSDGAMWCMDTTSEIKDSKIFHCRKQVENLICSDGFTTMKHVKIYDNHIEEAVFDIPEYLLECEDVKVYNNTYHKKGINNKNEKEIMWWDNKQLKWL